MLALAAPDWPRFRGPNGSGVADGQPLPAEFGPERNLIWKAAVPPGYSSPVIAGKRIFLTAAEGGVLITLALDRATGTTLWRREVRSARSEKLHKLNHAAAASAATDGRKVFVFFGDFGLLAYTAEGRELWRVPLGPFNNVYGMGASPVLANGLVVLVCDQSRGSFIAAFDAATGRMRWRRERPDAVSGHSTPAVHAGRILAPGSFRLDAYDASSGKPEWSFAGLPGEMKSVPVVDGGAIYVHGFNTPENDPGKLPAIPPFEEVIRSHDHNGDGRISRQEAPTKHIAGLFAYNDLDSDGFLDASEWASYQRVMRAENALLALTLDGRLKWRFQRSIPQLPSPLVYRGVVYMVNESGVATTIEAATGRLLKQARLRGAADRYYASPVAGDGKVFVASHTGVITVLKAGGGQETAAVNELDEEIMATPALAGGRIYVRSRSTMWCFGR